MEQRIFHGTITPEDFSRSLIAHFNRGNLRVQQVGSGERIAVQIATSRMPESGGHTALGIDMQKVADGVAINVGQQTWLGVAASLGMTALQALRNPFALINRLDDIAQDVESLQLTDEVWKVIEGTASAMGAGRALSERLRRIVCPYCGVANPVGEPSCIACGAPLGDAQPRTCSNCGYVLKDGERTCPNCGRPC
jgi:hypothetical protein